MATVQVFQFAAIDLGGGRVVKAGSLSEARCVNISADDVSDQTFSVAPHTAVKLFDAAAALGGFTFLWLECDLDLLLQFVADVGGTNAYDVKTLAGSGTADVMGPALVFGSNACQKHDGTINLFNGTASTVGQVWAYNPDATNTSRVRVIAAA